MEEIARVVTIGRKDIKREWTFEWYFSLASKLVSFYYFSILWDCALLIHL